MYQKSDSRFSPRIAFSLFISPNLVGSGSRTHDTRNEAVLKTDCPNRLGGSNICFLLELFTFLWYNVSTSLGLNIFIGVCFLKNTNTLEIVL